MVDVKIQRNPHGQEAFEKLLDEKIQDGEVIPVEMPYQVGSFRSFYYKMPSPIDIAGESFEHVIVTRLSPEVANDAAVIKGNTDYMTGAVAGQHNQPLKDNDIEIGDDEPIAYINLNLEDDLQADRPRMGAIGAIKFAGQAFGQLLMTRVDPSRRSRFLVVGNITSNSVEKLENDRNIQKMANVLSSVRMRYRISSVSCDVLPEDMTFDEVIRTTLTASEPANIIVQN